MDFAVGSLVRVRDREWVVLPGTDDEVVMVRPLGGTADEETGILRALEHVASAQFELPDVERPGDYRSARLLRDALRLGFRSSAGPFRSLGRIAVEPRPYQLVPLLMALRMDPVRLLIADDVGIGKTVEAALIARELLEQGDVRRLAVLCPPHLAEQWQGELADKFHLDATLVLTSTARRLERDLPHGRTIFEEHDCVIVSMDYIKSPDKRDDFVRTCPELVIVDEAHACALDGDGRARAGHQRHDLVARLSADPERHLILVTATPHSGKEGAFRSLLTLLDPDLATLPDDMSGDHNRRHRERLARHLVQRQRGDIYSTAEPTTFPKRAEHEETYRLSDEYERVFARVLSYAQEMVRDPAGGRQRQRVRWWSALALLRALASSPAAAAASLRTRADGAESGTVEEVDSLGRQTVLDLNSDDAEPTDVVAGAVSGGDADEVPQDTTLGRLADEVEALAGDADHKLVRGTEIVAKMVRDGFRPIVFCRFIATAEYVAEQLRARLPGKVEVTAVTGSLTASERELRIAALGEHPKRVLVATDCLSEGINLQQHFDAVVHYDLPWNPTRLEQREGRVDRFGQAEPEVRVVTFYGEDVGIDRIVLDVLLRKHRTIRNSLGISIPVPGSTDDVIEAVAEGLWQRADQPVEQMLPGMEEYLAPTSSQLHLDWDRAADREKRSTRLFAQHAIKVDEVMPEVEAVRAAIGSGSDVANFVHTAVPVLGGLVRGSTPVELDLSETAPAVRDVVGEEMQVKGRFTLPVGDDEEHLSRTHPLVAGLASYLLDSALDTQSPSAAAERCGVIRTDAVTTRTTVLLLRHRFHLVVTRRGNEQTLLAEDCTSLAFEGPAEDPQWLPPERIAPLLLAEPVGNVHREQATMFLSDVVAARDTWQPRVDADAHARADALLEAHTRVREAARERGVRVRVTPQLPADVLGIYVYLPGTAHR